jgi:nicotinamidase-related amidase
MAITQLDEKAALVVIDLQKGIVGAADSGAEVVRKSAELARAFRAKGLPVVLVNVAGVPQGRREAAPAKGMSFPADWTELVPELDQQASDLLVTKHSPGAFLGTNLDALLRERGVTQIFLAGISTGVGVESTARSAFDLGYNVVFVTDAMVDRDPEVHRFCTEKVFPRMGERDTTDGVLKQMRG